MSKDDETDVPRYKEASPRLSAHASPSLTALQATIHELFRLTWATDRLTSAASLDSQPKINDAALHLSAEYLRLFTVEAVHRAAQATKDEQARGVEKTSAANGMVEVSSSLRADRTRLIVVRR